MATSKLKDGGTFSKVLEELEWSGFIESYAPFGKIKKDKLFRLTDEFSLFYLTFMASEKKCQLATTGFKSGMEKLEAVTPSNPFA